GARAAADAEDDPPAAGVDGGPDHLADAVTARVQRIGPAAGQKEEPADTGQLDDREVTVAGVGGVDRLAGRAAGFHGYPLEAGGARCVDRARPPARNPLS